MDELKKDDSKGSKDETLLSEMRARKAAADEIDGHNRDEFEEDLRFLEGHGQWDSKVKAARDLQGRPCLTINKLPQFVSQVSNDIRMNRPSIRVKPVDSNADPEVAAIMEGLIRNIEYISRADQAYDTAGFYAVAGGRGFIMVETCYADDDAFDQDIKIKRVRNALTIYLDPDAQEADASDMSWALVTRLMPKKEFERRYPKAEATNTEGEDVDWFTKDSVRLAEYWTREKQEREIALLPDGMVVDASKVPEGVEPLQRRKSWRYIVKYHLCTGAKVIETKDWPGKYIPIVPVWGEEIDINGKVYLRGLIRNARDPQRMYNYWRTTATELVALTPKAPALVTQKQIEGHEDEWEEAQHTPKPYLPYNSDSMAPIPQRLENASVPAGVFTEAQVCQDDLKATTGIYDASLGNKGNEQSGKAILARQRQGDLSSFVFADNLARAITQVGRIIIDLIPHIYDTTRIVRVLGEDGTEENVKINQPTTPEQRMLNDLTIGKYDVQVVAGPSYGTKRQEAAETMMQMIQAVPNLAPLIGDLIAKNMDWPDADKVAERLRVMLPPEIKALEEETELPPEVQSMIQQMQQQLQAMSAQNAELQAMAQKSADQDKLKSQELDIKRQELALKGYELWMKAQLEDRKLDLDLKKDDQDTAIKVAELTMAYRDDLLQVLVPIFEQIQAQHEQLSMAIMPPPPEMPEPMAEDMPPPEMIDEGMPPDQIEPNPQEPAQEAGFLLDQ